MKKTLSLLFTLSLTALAFGQKPLPVQTALIDSSIYVVELIPIEVAKRNISEQLTQVNKQVETVERQTSELVKKRDDLMKQKAVLEAAQKQLAEATATEEAKKQVADPPPTESKAAKPPKKKN